MKNRNIPYYAAALLLAAGVSTSFMSCVDTDEPESIAKLRDAKAKELEANANYLNQKAAKETALAAVEQANANYRNAEASEMAAKAVAQELTNAATRITNAKDSLALAFAKDTLAAVKDSIIAIKKTKYAAEYQAAKQALETAIVTAKCQIEKESNDLAIAKQTAKVALAKFNAEGIVAEGATKGEVRLALEEYNDQLDVVAKKTKALNKAIGDVETLNKSEDALQADVDAKQAKYDDLVDAQNQFNELAQEEEVQAWIDKYDELQKKIDDLEPTNRSLEYAIKELEQKMKPFEDKFIVVEGEGSYQEAKQDWKFEVPTLLQATVAGKSWGNLKASASGDVIKGEEIVNNKIADEFKELINFLIKGYTNKLTADANAQLAISAKKALDDYKENTADALEKAWNTAVTNYNKKADDSNLDALKAASKDYFGVETLDGALFTSKPTLDQLKAKYPTVDAAEQAYYTDLGVFAQVNNLDKQYKDANLTTPARTLQNALEEAITSVDTEIANQKAKRAAQEADAEYVKLKNEKTAKETQKANNSTDNEKELQGIIEKFALKYFNATEKKDAEDKVIGWEVTEVKFSDENLPFDDEKFQEDLQKAKDFYKEDIENAERDLKLAKAKLEKYQKAVKEEDFSGYFNEEAIEYIKAIETAQDELDTAQKDLDKKEETLNTLKKAYGLTD